jgi:hypothetical protein
MKPKTVVTIQYFRVPSEKSCRPSAIRGRAARIWASRPLKPAASKTRKKTSAAIRASSPSPLVTDRSAPSATPAKLVRSTLDAAFCRTSVLSPKPASQPSRSL